jgi:hypothetical protein
VRKKRNSWSRIPASFADGSVDQLPYDVQLADVARILLQQMGEDPAERWRIAGEPATEPGPIGQLSIAPDGFGARGDRDPSCRQVGDVVVRCNEPALPVRSLVASRVWHLLGFEAPLHPTPLHEDKVLEQSER